MTMSKTVPCVALAVFVAGAVPASAQTVLRAVRAEFRDNAAGVPLDEQQNRETQTDRQTKTFKLGSDGELSLGNVAGDIQVTAVSGDQATLEIVKTARGRTADDAREMLGLVNVNTTERGSRVEVKTLYPRGENRNERHRNIDVSVAYTVTAPAGTRVTAGSVSGSISVDGIKGDLSANSVSGTVRIANAGRVSSAKSVSGNVEVLDTQIDGAIEVQSVSGDVILRKVNARRIEIGSVSGRVLVQDVQAERIEGHSVSGNVEYSGALAKGGRYELNSHSGDVRLTIGSGTGFEIEASSFSGSIRSDLPLKSGDRDADSTPGRHRTLNGVFGDGSAVLDVSTFSGNIVLSKR
jgi:DUF4097 and DUF4098 domain-containing protein YvlB